LTEFIYVKNGNPFVVVHDSILIPCSPVYTENDASNTILKKYTKLFPQGFGLYRLASQKNPELGSVVLLEENNDVLSHAPVFAFIELAWPTSSKLEWITRAFASIHNELKLRPWLTDIAIPHFQLGLSWDDICKVLETELEGIRQLVYIYGPIPAHRRLRDQQ